MPPGGDRSGRQGIERTLSPGFLRSGRAVAKSDDQFACGRPLLPRNLACARRGAGGQARVPMTEANKSVFLSYASVDLGAALKISSALRTAGIEVWFDQSELRGGDAWDAAIRRQIKACTLFVPLISRHTRARQEAYF